MTFGLERTIRSRSGWESVETVHWVWRADPQEATLKGLSFSRIDSAIATQVARIGDLSQVSVNAMARCLSSVTKRHVVRLTASSPGMPNRRLSPGTSIFVLDKKSSPIEKTPEPSGTPARGRGRRPHAPDRRQGNYRCQHASPRLSIRSPRPVVPLRFR